VQQLVKGLVESGHQVLLIGPGENVVGGAQFLRLTAITTSLDGYPLAIPCPASVDRALQRFRPEVISAHTIAPAGLLGLALAHRHGIPAIFSWHTDFEFYARVYPMSWLLAIGSYLPIVLNGIGRPALDQRRGRPGPHTGRVPRSMHRASRWMSAVCVPAQSAVKHVRKCGIEQPVYVMPADVTAEDLGVGGDAARRALHRVPGAGAIPYLLYIGRMSREKNLELLITAFARGVRPPARLVMVGPANDSRTRAMLRSRAAEMPGRIVLIDSLPRHELGEIYRRAAAFVTPSLSETQSLCIWEAIVLGVPVLVVDPRLAEGSPSGTVRVVPAHSTALAAAMIDSLRSQAPERSGSTEIPPLEKLSLRFVAAAESVGTAAVGTTLQWKAGRWSVSSATRNDANSTPE
jgi:1,2-diacylglycerol 3-alpha-glucosyltransferase